MSAAVSMPTLQRQELQDRIREQEVLELALLSPPGISSWLSSMRYLVIYAYGEKVGEGWSVLEHWKLMAYNDWLTRLLGEAT